MYWLHIRLKHTVWYMPIALSAYLPIEFGQVRIDNHFSTLQIAWFNSIVIHFSHKFITFQNNFLSSCLCFYFPYCCIAYTSQLPNDCLVTYITSHCIVEWVGKVYEADQKSKDWHTGKKLHAWNNTDRLCLHL